MVQEITTYVAAHWTAMLGTLTFWSILGHAVNTFPIQKNPYAAWFLGVFQFAVGQRAKAFENFKNGVSVNN